MTHWVVSPIDCDMKNVGLKHAWGVEASMYLVRPFAFKGNMAMEQKQDGVEIRLRRASTVQLVNQSMHKPLKKTLLQS